MYSRGKRFIFSVGDNNDLVPNELCVRIKINPEGGQCTFIQSTCLTNLGASCVGVEWGGASYDMAIYKKDWRSNNDGCAVFFYSVHIHG
jgi:hypothetical protein